MIGTVDFYQLKKKQRRIDESMMTNRNDFGGPVEAYTEIPLSTVTSSEEGNVQVVNPQN